MIIQDITNVTRMTKVLCKCDNCGVEFDRLLHNIKNSRRERNSELDYCKSCSCKLSVDKKPQCSRQFWTDEKKEEHSNSIKNSEVYYDAISTRNTSGDKNGMFGKQLSKETKAKMSKSRTGKKQSSVTIRKRTLSILMKPKKTSLNVRVKGYIHKNINWYFRVYQRDGFKCTECDSKIKIDAHHIKPISLIIKEKLDGRIFDSESDKYLFLINDPDIIDVDLKNGITLCRECHKKIHNKWGSHNV